MKVFLLSSFIPIHYSRERCIFDYFLWRQEMPSLSCHWKGQGDLFFSAWSKQPQTIIGPAFNWIFCSKYFVEIFSFFASYQKILPKHHSDKIWKCFKESQSLAVLRAYGSYQWWIFGIYTVFGSPDGVNGADESESVSYILIQAVFIKYISGSVLYILINMFHIFSFKLFL